MKSSACRSPAAVASNKDDSSSMDLAGSSDSLLPSAPTPLYVPVASRYIGRGAGYRFLPKLLGEDHVDPDVHVRHNFEQRMRAIREAENDQSLHRVHDIGFPRLDDTRARRVERATELREARKRMKADVEMERASRLRQLEVDPVECELEDARSGDGEDLDVAKNCALHYGVFRDLFGRHAVFNNVVNVDVSFPASADADGEEIVAPVFYGNFVDAVHCSRAPNVEIDECGREDESSLWTLVMTSPDQNFVQSNNEFLHWMVGNISGSCVSSGAVVVPYIPPFPLSGFGPLRYVFVLYKQDARIDFSALTEANFDDATTALARRSFSSYQFLRQHQDVLTPASQRFFQSTYDDSVTSVFYDLLDMKEPSYGYDWPEPERPLQYKYPEKTPFNEYLDLYRDRKDINEQVLKERLSMMISPFDGYPAPERWPNAGQFKPWETETWLEDEIMEKRLKRGKWRDLDIRD